MPSSVFPGRLLLLLLTFSLAAVRSVSAQIIEGNLLDAETLTPISMGTVALLDTLMTELRQVTTDKRGRFRIEAPGAGHYYVLADALGYKRTLDGILELGEGGRISVDFFLNPEPVELEPLSVEAQSQRIVQHLELQGFYDRKAEGFGHFISPEEIEKKNAREFHTLLRNLPNLRVTGGGVGGTQLKARFMGHDCDPVVYKDGTMVNIRAYGRASALEEVLSIDDVISVEWYDGPASIPLQWGGTSLFGFCGVIVFWTKSG